MYQCMGMMDNGVVDGRWACVVSTTLSFKCIHKMYNTTI